MKKVVVMLAVIFSINYSANAQTGVPDTLVYLKSIATNKASYIGQPFSTLLNALQIQIQFFSPLLGRSQDRTQETSTFFGFYFPATASDLYLSYPLLKISWQSSLNATTSGALYEANNKGGWVQDVINFYSSAIIQDIVVVEKPGSWRN